MPEARRGPPSRAEAVYEQVKHDVADFRLVPGDRFSENELCERLGVSRTPVRQALFRLQQEGVVEVLFRSGWRVLPFDFERFDQLYDLRTVLEATSARRLCADRSGLAASALAGLAADWLVPAAERARDPAQLDEHFHCALVAATGNAEMARVHRELTDRIRVLRRLDFTQPARVAATYEEHGRILQALRRGRGEQAALLLSAHIGASQAEVRKITLHQFYRARAGTPKH